MILATIRMTLPLQERARVLKTLKSMVKEARIQLGCISSRIYHDDEEDVFMFEDVWRNQDDLDRYLRSEDYLRMLLVMEMAEGPPEIKFQTISNQAGLEVVEKARGCKADERV